MCLDHSFKSNVLLSFSSGDNSTGLRCLDASNSVVFNKDSGSIGGTTSAVFRRLESVGLFFLRTKGLFFRFRLGLCLAGKVCRIDRPLERTKKDITLFCMKVAILVSKIYFILRFSRSIVRAHMQPHSSHPAETGRGNVYENLKLIVFYDVILLEENI